MAMGGTGCIHTYPKGEPQDPTLLSASLSLTLDISLSHIGESETRLEIPGGLYRFIVVVSRENKTEIKYETHIRLSGSGTDETTLTLPTPLPPGKHDVAVWCDLAESSLKTPLHYNADNLSAISILPFTEGVYATAAKLAPPLCACTVQSIELRKTDESRQTVSIPLSLTPPIGIIRIEATDSETFLRHYPEAAFMPEAYSVTLDFSSPVSCSFNLFSSYPASYTSGYDVSSSLLIPDSSSSTLLKIPVFPSPEGEELTADLIVYDRARQIVARTKDIPIPVMRDRTSVVRGAFLSNFFESPLRVDYEWEGEIIIEHKQ